LIDYLNYRLALFPETNFKYLFTLYEKGSAVQLTEQKLNIAIKSIGRNAGLKQNVHPHLFRHSLATHLLQDGWNIADVKEKLRHENIATTSIYVHSDPVMIKLQTKSI
jgi:site-specific recombinase XerD